MGKTWCGKESRLQAPKGITSKAQIIKNLLILSSGFLLLFTAYDGLSNLQSTINREQGIGVTSQATVYVSFCISALLFPKYVIQKIGCKNTITLSMLTYVPYISSNFYPHWILMIPSSILTGLGASLLWGAQCTYLNEIAKLYFQASSKTCTSNSANDDEDKIITSGKNLIRKYSLSFSRRESDKRLRTSATSSLPNIFKMEELKISDAKNTQHKITNNILHKEENYSTVNVPDSSNFTVLTSVKGNIDNQDNVSKGASSTEISVLNVEPPSSVSVLHFKVTDTNSNICSAV
ncbi:Protein unc-93-like protein, partial [Stegodyphus mimosarum]